MERLKGIAMIITGSVLWGATGPMMEWLLEYTTMTAEFMLAVRLIIAGIFILSILMIQKSKVMIIWKNRYWATQLIIFSMIGMVGLQYTFVKTIEVSDAIVATLLQFLAPIFIILYMAMFYKTLPPKSQFIGIIGTLLGLYLLLTNGSMSTLLVSTDALVWGVFLGLTYAFYTLYPARLMAEVGVIIIIGWGMIISGIVFAFMGKVWQLRQWVPLADSFNFSLIFGISIFGAIAYILFLTSLKYISPVETSILSSFEPLTAMLISVIWLGSVLYEWQLLGILLMLIFVAYLSISGGKKSKNSTA
ncbi:MAG: EamA family transporter [Solibacillus sp.]|uniref:DMT family transporter n=1 Tax=Solibacillus sp. TaxID=1909654 RepID=UPI003314726E